MRRFFPLCVLLALAPLPAGATTKGLNQIVTPDVQPLGTYSLSFQRQDPNIGNRTQAQFEFGIARGLEFAVFQGASPPQEIVGLEGSLYHRGPYLLSTGVLNWSIKGTAPQPFLEGGYYKQRLELIFGAQRVVNQESAGVSGSVRARHEMQGILGAAYQVQPRVLLQVDYQSGASNSATAGFTYALTPALQVNPSLYCANVHGHPLYGYAVLTWNLRAF